MLHLILQHILWFMIRTLMSTWRVEVRRADLREKAKTMNPAGSFVFALWHEHVVSVMTGHAWTEPYLALASRSKDGDYAAFISKKMGFTSVRGSSRKGKKDKGGKEALLEYVHKLKLGVSGGLTVDGPKGPRQECKPGIVLMSKETGAPVLPVVALASSFWQFNSWDKFKIPKPFAKIVMLYGEPLLPQTPEEVTEALKSVERELRANLS